MSDTNSSGPEPGLQADQRLLNRGWLKIGAGLAVAGQAMVFSSAVNLSESDGTPYWVVHGILLATSLATLAFLGGDLVRSAFESLRGRRISIDLLFLLTLLGALVGSIVSTFARVGAVYYEVVAILIVVHTAGKMLGARSRVAALQAATATREVFDHCDWLQGEGQVQRVRVQDLPAGALVRVATGGPISVDGVIVSGRGYIQETSMTGEWQPVVRGPGELVWAGTYSVDAVFDVRTRQGRRRLDDVLEEVERARVAPSELQAQADRLMAWFLPIVASVSLVTFGVWWYHTTWDRALFNAMAVLLVACPCAMGLATPVAVWGGLAQLARIGLVGRTGDVLDRLARVEVICLDKTGTLSADELTVAEWCLRNTEAGDAHWLKNAVAALESGHAHPIARALVGSRTELPAVRGSHVVPGRGVAGWVETPNGTLVEVRVGEWAIGVESPLDGAVRDLQPVGVARPSPTSAAVLAPAAGTKDRAGSPGKRIWVFVDGEPAGHIDLAERWRGGLVEAIDGLARLQLEVEVLSGDPTAEQALHQELGAGLSPRVRVHAGLTPMDKKKRIEHHRAAGRRVVVVGDGINDAAALSSADMSIAVSTGTQLARASSMAILAGDDLRVLPASVELARRARRSIESNLLFAAGYNSVGMLLAAAGKLHPVVAALLMVGSSAFVSVRALRSAARGEGSGRGSRVIPT